MSQRRVVVTGLGVISPVGNTVDEAWSNLLAGRSGIGPVTRFDASAYNSRIAGEVKDFDVARYIPAKHARHMDLFIQYGVAAGIQAVRDSGLTITDSNSERIGTVLGAGVGALPMIERTHTDLQNRGPARISPFFMPATLPNMISGWLSVQLGLRGPNLSISTACTTGLHCIGQGARLIEHGDADVLVCGGADATISPLGVGGFACARALSSRNETPTTASRPWDRDRDGFVIGEGAGAVVLEAYEHAKARGGRIYAEVIGFGMSADAHHITSPAEDGDGGRRSMVNAMKNAKINPEDVDYLNAHGTSTPAGDLAETIGIKRTFGDHASKLVVNSTKSMTGHLLGGAGGLESVVTILALYHQVSPPTTNIFNQDPSCDLDYCANEARNMRIDIAVKNSFGFGGTNGTLVFSRAA
jgi:3-oxoacyl-[acyl-carrier-protein] synthase II